MAFFSNLFSGKTPKLTFKKFTYDNGDVYEGQFYNDLKHGKGKYIWANGDIYEGDFIDDQRTGKGKLSLSNGEVYEGDLKNGKKHGEGSYSWPNGDHYMGAWKNDVYHGIGILDINKRIKSGPFTNGVFELDEGLETGKSTIIGLNGKVLELDKGNEQQQREKFREAFDKYMEEETKREKQGE